MIQYHWFWFYVPFVAMGSLFLALPLITDGLSKGFDFQHHRDLVANWRPRRTRRWTCSCPSAASRWRCSATPGSTCR